MLAFAAPIPSMAAPRCGFLLTLHLFLVSFLLVRWIVERKKYWGFSENCADSISKLGFISGRSFGWTRRLEGSVYRFPRRGWPSLGLLIGDTGTIFHLRNQGQRFTLFLMVFPAISFFSFPSQSPLFSYMGCKFLYPWSSFILGSFMEKHPFGMVIIASDALAIGTLSYFRRLSSTITVRIFIIQYSVHQ